MEILKRTWADVDLDALEHNVHEIRRHVAGDAIFLGVVKADAYGHGAVPVSRALMELGAGYLAVSNLEEAVQLRRGGLDLPILILGYTPPAYAAYMAEHKLTQEVHSIAYAEALEAALAGTDCVLCTHLKMDTGMSRIGFRITDDENAVAQMVQAARLPHLWIEGAFMHFCVADSTAAEDASFTKLQYDRFVGALEELSRYGIRPELRHCCNSGAVLQHPEYALDMIRPGILTYGIAPSAQTQGIVNLKPLLELHTTISQVREVPCGTDIGYGRTYTAQSVRRIATLAIGYADGLRRELSGSYSFLLHGRKVPVVGKICMDMCMVDVTDVPQAQMDDVVTVIGDTNSCGKMAQTLGTIEYEVLCDIGKRVPRMYWKENKLIDTLRYIV